MKPTIFGLDIDGHKIQSSCDTLLIHEENLKPDVIFNTNEIKYELDSEISDKTQFSGIINKYKDNFGKKYVVVIESRLGYPIYAFSCNDVDWDMVPGEFLNFKNYR